MSALTLYKASAGSGKTFALTLSWFRLVFASPFDYRHILAVTFTNKATEEMKSRIINELHRLASGDDSPYLAELQGSLGFTPGQIRERAVLLRTLLLHDYGRLSVTTIDRFFQRLLKAFTRELGVFPGYSVELDSQYVLLRAVDRLMSRLGECRELREWIYQLMEEQVEEARSWAVREQLTDLGRELFGELYALLESSTLERFNDKGFLNEYRRFLRQLITSFEECFRGWRGEAAQMLSEAGLHPTDFKGSSRSFASYFPKWADVPEEAINNTFRKVLDQPDEWVVKKADPALRARVEALYPALNELIRTAITYYDSHQADYRTARQIYKHLYQLGILNDLYREIRAFCEEKGVLLLSDTNRILYGLIHGNEAPFLYEKTGNYYKHLLIDEFQDTSTLQWENFKPLVVNAISQGGEVLLVGDVKQSIYRWRNGDWRLLAEGVARELSTWTPREVMLDKNWRSAPEVVAFNNLFFQAAAGGLKALFDEECEPDNRWSDSIAEAYRALEQLPCKTNPGYVEVQFFGEKSLPESRQSILEAMAERVEGYLERGGALSDCVVLVRKAEEGAAVARYLMEYNREASRPIPFLSNDSLFLSASPAVELILAALRREAEPDNEINAALIRYLYHAYLFPESSPGNDALFRQTASGGEAWDAFGTPSAVAANASLFDRVEAIIATYRLFDRPEAIPYLIAFQEVIYEYEAKNINSLTLFLEWWEKEGDKRVLSTSESGESLRILTIHKSKGLEFKTVFLPFCNWKLDDVRQGRRIWGHNHRQRFDALPEVPVSYSSKLKDTHFREDYFEEHMKSYVDNLNLLYVAFTRAQQELYVLPYTPGSSGKPADIGAFTLHVLEAMAAGGADSGWDGASYRYQRGTPPLMGHSEKQTPPLPEPEIREYPLYPLGGRIRIRFRYESYTDPQAAGNAPVEEGKLLHDIFRHIDTPDDVDRAVAAALRQGLIGQAEAVHYVAQIREYLRHPEVTHWYSGSYRVLSERDILYPSNRQVRPDRVMVSPEETLIVDYKFGQHEDTRYPDQVRYYCRTLSRMGYKNVRGYLWYVALGKVVEITKTEK